MLIGSDSYYVFVVSFSEVSARVSVRKLPSLPDRDMTTAVWCVLPDVFAKMMTALADGGQLRDHRRFRCTDTNTASDSRSRQDGFPDGAVADGLLVASHRSSTSSYLSVDLSQTMANANSLHEYSEYFDKFSGRKHLDLYSRDNVGFVNSLEVRIFRGHERVYDHVDWNRGRCMRR